MDVHLTKIDGLILEYDFKRRGLRMDVILLTGKNAIVIEFKRSKLTATDSEQVVNYCVNLCEFHEVTQKNIKNKAFEILHIQIKLVLLYSQSDGAGIRFEVL